MTQHVFDVSLSCGIVHFSMNFHAKKIPNALTISRIALIPVFFVAFYIDLKFSKFVSAVIFLFASLTDFFDGYLARSLSAQSKFGRLFDPIADKMIVTTAIVMLVYSGGICSLSLIPAIIILCREFFISGFREYLADQGKNLKVIA